MALDEVPYVVTGLIGAFSAVFLLFLWHLACAPYRIQKDRAEAAENELRKRGFSRSLSPRLTTEQQRLIAGHLRGIELGQDHLNVFYFQASEECADLAIDIAGALTMSGWEASAETSAFGSDTSQTDVSVQISGKDNSTPVAAALESALRIVGLRVHLIRYERGKPNVSVYVGRPS